MTRKDYQMLSGALVTVRPSLQWDEPADVKDACVRAIADALARDNPRFDRERFLRDAGVQP